MQQVGYVYDPASNRHIIYLRFPDDSYVQIVNAATTRAAHELISVLGRWHDNWMGHLPAAHKENGSFDPTGKTSE